MMDLNGDWKLQGFDVGEVRDLEIASPDYVDHFWMTAKVPGDVHSALKAHRLIEDPFYGHNDLKCRWVENKVWWYRKTFEFYEPLHPEDRLELIFEGLDTFATVYLNGLELGTAANMFIRHTFDVTREIKQGRNVLAVKFEPIRLHVKEKAQNYWSAFSPERIWTRKAQSQFGWDWGPRIVTTGIWQGVRLEKRTYAKIEDVFAKTRGVTGDRAFVDIAVDVARFVKDKTYTLDLSIRDDLREVSKTVDIDGPHTAVTLEVEHPKLWWTHDLGEPHLYEITATLYADGQPVDRQCFRFGIRTLEVQQSDENGNPRFTFVLNGVKLFAKGANWIPVDSLIASAPDSRYHRLIEMAKAANMNMLRVWGGGIYEKDVFYETCDRLGILVWQDFMFACALYPDYNRNFMENVRKEITLTVKRLRNHPSLAIWCGNNENDWIYEVMKSSGEIAHPFYGEKIYHELIPALLEELDPTRLYWPSSPYGGNDHNSRDYGDSHNWQVWHGNVEPRKFGEPQRVDYSVSGVSFKNYKKDTAKFVSEFGMHAASNRYTLRKYIPENEFYWGSEEMAYRNKDAHHPKGLLLMEGYTGVPKNIDEYLAYSMLTQAEGLKYGVEHYRRNKPNTSGALIWQLNDCWPGTSWSLIDYHLLPKASYYYAKKFFHPLLLNIDHDPGQPVKVWVVNDRLAEYEDEIELAVYDFSGETVFSKRWAVRVPANAAAQIDEVPEAVALTGRDPREVFMVLRSTKGRANENYYYFRDHKDMRFPVPRLTVAVDRENRKVTVQTDVFARMVTIELDSDQLIFEDNFFDLMPGVSKTVRIDQADGRALPWETLRVTAVGSEPARMTFVEGC